MNASIEKAILPAVLLMGIQGNIGTDLYVPSLPAITRYFGVSSQMVQLSITFYALGIGIGPLLHGPLSDRFGRRPIALYGLALAVLGCLVALVSWTPHMLLAGRFLQGFGLAAAALLARAVPRDVFQGAALAKLGSYSGIASALAIGIAPTVGGFIEAVSHWRVSFVVMFLFALATAVHVYYMLPETHHQLNHDALKPKQLFKNYWPALKHSGFWGYALTSGLGYSGFIVYAICAPFLLQNVMGVTPLHYGFLSLFTAVAFGVSMFTNGQLIERLGLQTALRIGLTLMFIGGMWLFLLGILHMATIWSVVFAMVLFTSGTGFVMSNTFAGAFTPFKQNLGSVAAVYGAIQNMVAVVASILVTLAPHSAISLGLAFACMGALAVGTLLIFVGKDWNLPEDAPLMAMEGIG
jgi:MFS transporter, DHA1 family, 2-module integral membrane pump EmrD